MQSVTQVLESRRAKSGNGRRIGGLFGAALLHAIVVAAAIVVPQLLRKPPVPVEYVAVKLMPAPAPRARSAAATPRAAPTPAPRPAATPEPKPPAPEPPQPETSRPVLPDPSSRRPPTATRQSTPAPQPTPGPASGGGTGGGSAVSATASVGGFDNPSFTYGYYVERMLALIRGQWTRPPLGGELELIVNFRIATDGTVLNARVVKSSGYNAFDLAGLRAVQSASPLPPLPRSFREDSIGVHLIFR